MKYNKEMTTHIVSALKSNLLVGIIARTPPRVGKTWFFIVCESSGRTCQLIQLFQSDANNKKLFQLQLPLSFQSSLDMLANTRETAKAAKPIGLAVSSMKLKFTGLDRLIDPDSNQSQSQPSTSSRSHLAAGLTFVSTGETYIMHVKHRKDYTKRDATEEPANRDDTTLMDVDQGEPANAGDVKQTIEDGSDVESNGSQDSDIVGLERELQGMDADDDVTDTISSSQGGQDGEPNPNNEGAQNVGDTDLQNDLHELQQSHEKFVGAASQLQADHEFCDADRLADEVVQGNQPYNDEFGEALLERFVQQHAPNMTASARLPNQQDQQTSFRRRRVDDINLSSAIITGALMKWSRQVNLSGEACTEIALSSSRFDSTNYQASMSHAAALILYENNDSLKVDLVSWTTPFKRLEGRCIGLDDEQRVIYPSHFTVMKRSFASSVFILSDVGARVRKQDRELVKDSVLRIRSMFETAIDSLGVSSSSFESTCVACSQPEVEGHTLRRCANCLLHWHDTCSVQSRRSLPNFLASTTTTTALSDLALTPDTMPFILWLGVSEFRYVICRIIHLAV